MLGAVDVLVLTALKEELDALLQVTEGMSGLWTVGDAGGVPVHRAVLEGSFGSIKVVATHQTKMAGSATAALAATLAERLKPACLAMCGVCAGHPTDTELGDVVLADRVFQHDEGKNGADGFQADLCVDSLREDWLRVAQKMVGPAKDLHGYQAPDDTIWKWWLLDTISTGRDPLKMATFQRFIPSERREERLTVLLDEDLVHLDGETLVLSEKGTREIQRRRVLVGGIASDRPTALPYHIHVGPMGSGNAVEASGASWDRIGKGGERKVLAVEMEAAALGRVAHDRGLRLAVAKGVMDHATPWKRDGYKPFAARAAAEVLCRFLRAVVKPSGPATGVTGRNNGGGAARASDGPGGTLHVDVARESSPPRVFISWSHEPDPESEAARTHRARVLALADQLHAGGVDAQLDLYDPHPPEGWPTWMSSGIEEADFILIVCSATYLRRWKGEVIDGKGLGVRWEGLNLRNLLFREPARQARVVPILFEGASPGDIPLEVAGASTRRLPAEYPDLYRHLTNQPALSKPALGPLRRSIENIDAPAYAITGRHGELARIDAGLARGGAAALVQAISGLGGVGKTRIALEYAHTRAVHYVVRWWTYAHRLESDLADLARELGVATADDAVDRAAKAARTYLRNHDGWLLVIDNADDLEPLRALLPKLGPGHVLITSRAAAWHGAATPIEVNVLPPDVACELLLERSRRPDDGHAAELAQTLGYLPLALVQAAAYLENTHDTFADYLDTLRSDGLDLFDDPLSDAHDPLHGDSADAHRRTVARTWRPSIEAVRNDSDHGPAAVALLDFLAFFDPDGFSLALLHDKPDLLPSPLRPLAASKRAIRSAIALLRRYSLVDRGGDRVRVHRLVQDVTRAALPADRRQVLAAEVVTWARAVFGYDQNEPRIGAVPAGIAAQLLALGERIECVGVAGSKLVFILDELSEFLLHLGDAATALRAGRRALAIAEDLGKADPHSAQAQRNLMLCLYRLGDKEMQFGDLDRAHSLTARSVAIAEDLARATPYSPEVQRDLAVALDMRGLVKDRAGDRYGAHDLFARCTRIFEDLAKSDPHSLAAQRDFALSLARLRDLGIGASELAARSLSILEDLAQADPHSLAAQRDLASAYENAALAEAPMVFRGGLMRAREIRAACEGAPETLRWLTRAVAIRASLLTQDPSSATAARELAVALGFLGQAQSFADDESAALESRRRAASIFAQLRRAGALDARYSPMANFLARMFPDA
ncbi:MAG: TIR domain-containing protein [Myxococcales bacterium]|nr:TIR domain-containing protein [Myxococcales bacterium]